MDTATQHDQDHQIADDSSMPDLYIRHYELLQLLSDALRDVCRASAPHRLALVEYSCPASRIHSKQGKPSLNEQCNAMVRELVDVERNKKSETLP